MSLWPSGSLMGLDLATTHHSTLRSFGLRKPQEFWLDRSNYTNPGFLQEQHKNGSSKQNSPRLTRGQPAWPCTAWGYFRHTPISASSSATKHGSGLKQAAQKRGWEGGEGCPHGPTGWDLTGFVAFYSSVFFILLTWQTAPSLRLYSPSHILQLLNFCVPCILKLERQTGYNPEIIFHLFNT